MERTTKQEMYFELAKANAKRATCLRRKFGAVIVKDDVAISMGYCGAPRGRKNCIDIGKCLREEQNVPSGQRYELCRSVHAEQNAVINAATTGVNVSGGDLYLYGIEAKTGEIAGIPPCTMCKRVLINAKIKNVYVLTKEGYNHFKIEDWVRDEDF